MSSALRKSHDMGKSLSGVQELQRLLEVSDHELAVLLHVTPRTLYRWMEHPPSDHAPLLRLQELVEVANKSLRPEALGEWFHERNRALGGSIPILLAADPRGYELVYDLLWDAYHGLPL